MTSRSAARASSSARASRGSPTSASRAFAPTATCSSGAKELADAGAGEELLADGRRSAPRRGRARRRVLSPGAVVWSRDAHHRRHAPRPPDRGAEGRADAPDRRPRPRGALQPRRPRRRRRRCSTSSPGSGALGLEALSRGARRCVFAETDPAASRVIRQNLESLGLTGALVLQRDAVSVLREERTAGRRHELILLDPPYGAWAGARAGARGPPSRGRERRRASSSSRPTRRTEPALPLDLVTTRRYGSARLTLFAP